MRSTLMFLLRALLVAVGLRDAADMPPLRIAPGGRALYVFADGSVIPAIAGAEDDGDDDDEDEDEDGADDDEEAESDDDGEDEDGADDDSDDVDEDELPPKVKAILRKERQARRKAEREARREKRRADSRRRDDDEDADDEDEDDDERRETRRRGRRRERETRSDEVDRGTEKLRRANLLTALADEGYTGKRGKALARLLDEVDYDEDDEPENLSDAIEAAEEKYGKSLVGKPKRRPGNTGGREGGDGGERPSLTADELEAAKAFRMTPEEYAEFKKTNPTLPDKKSTDN